MPENESLVPCYNRGCGQMFDPNNNDKDVCQHHPGAPIFHDAYKGWSCCNKKSVDFTEFLNIKGCTLSKHSNVKPPEPEKKRVDHTVDQEIIVVRAPIVSPQLTRPPIETEMINILPNVADSLKNLVQTTSQRVEDTVDDGTVEVGTLCKNGGCNVSYQGPQTNDTPCVHHPGCPIFHEGLKFWSCCQKRTTDFNVFLNQPGCITGTHRWKKENTPSGTVKCRWDWHQTPEYVIVSVYAKKYDPVKSYIKMNPIRLNTKLVFPEEGDATFELDLELRGIACVEKSNATMTPSKVEIKMKKAEPGAWTKLDFPRTESKKEPTTSQDTKSQDDDDLVDLSSVEAITSIGKVNITECTE